MNLNQTYSQFTRLWMQKPRAIDIEYFFRYLNLEFYSLHKVLKCESPLLGNKQMSSGEGNLDDDVQNHIKVDVKISSNDFRYVLTYFESL